MGVTITPMQSHYVTLRPDGRLQAGPFVIEASTSAFEVALAFRTLGMTVAFTIEDASIPKLVAATIRRYKSGTPLRIRWPA